MSASAFLPGDVYLQLPRDPQPWVIRDLIPVSGLTNLYGKPKAGKSFAALGMAHAIASGQPDWLGFQVLKSGPVAYLQIDTPREEWAGRVHDMRNQGMDMHNVNICDMFMLGFYPFNILDPDHFNWLKAQLEVLKPVVVFIDTIREAHNGDENDSTVMKNVVTGLVAACRPAAMVFLSHSRKDTMFTSQGGDDLMADARGSSYIAGRMDCVIKMTGNGKHATGMQYKGRSKGNGRVSVAQHEETGLILLDGEDAAYHALIEATANDMLTKNHKVSVKAIADRVETLTTHKKHRTITKHVKAYLAKVGVQKDDDE